MSHYSTTVLQYIIVYFSMYNAVYTYILLHYTAILYSTTLYYTSYTILLCIELYNQVQYKTMLYYSMSHYITTVYCCIVQYGTLQYPQYCIKLRHTTTHMHTQWACIQVYYTAVLCKVHNTALLQYYTLLCSTIKDYTRVQLLYKTRLYCSRLCCILDYKSILYCTTIL